MSIAESKGLLMRPSLKSSNVCSWPKYVDRVVKVSCACKEMGVLAPELSPRSSSDSVYRRLESLTLRSVPWLPSYDVSVMNGKLASCVKGWGSSQFSGFLVTSGGELSNRLYRGSPRG